MKKYFVMDIDQFGNLKGEVYAAGWLLDAKKRVAAWKENIIYALSRLGEAIQRFIMGG